MALYDGGTDDGVESNDIDELDSCNFFSYLELAVSSVVIFCVLVHYLFLNVREAGVISLVYLLPNAF